jgi:hypothetical protein
MNVSTRTILGAAFGTLLVMSAIIPVASAATAEERAKCEEMMKGMGLGTVGTPPKSATPDTMTPQHARCKEILGEVNDPTTKHPDSKHHEGDKK